ncbi:MAG: lysophospholipid acyltransferase family protein [Rhodothermales bacterium]
MRPVWRLTRAFFSTLAHCVHLILTLHRVPEADRPRYRAYKQQAGCRGICRALDVEVQLHGELPSQDGMLAVSNHLGLLDTVAIASRLHVTFVSKAEVRHWPFVGWVTRLVGVIFVERERKMQTGQLVEQVQQRLREGVSVLVFPEGTTSNGTGVLTFKTGSFAAVAGLPDTAVLPLCLKGVSVAGREDPAFLRQVLTWTSETTMFKHAWQLLKAKRIVISLHVGEPVATAGRDRKELARLTQEAVESLGGFRISEGASS